jgi:acetyltransferase-like isoleucine patch superfamily enzyme
MGKYRNTDHNRGRNTYGDVSMDLIHGINLNIGSFCSLGAGFRVLAVDHNTKLVSTYPFDVLWRGRDVTPILSEKGKGDINIGNDVWIGENVTVMSGVTIGNGVCIGTRSVVTKNIPAYAIIAGVPAVVRKYRFNESQIVALERIQWWNWPDEKISSNYDLFMSENIDKFISTFS